MTIIPLFPSSPLRKNRGTKLGEREQVGMRRGTRSVLEPQGIQRIGGSGGAFHINK